MNAWASVSTFALGHGSQFSQNSLQNKVCQSQLSLALLSLNTNPSNLPFHSNHYRKKTAQCMTNMEKHSIKANCLHSIVNPHCKRVNRTYFELLFNFIHLFLKIIHTLITFIYKVFAKCFICSTIFDV